MHRPEAAFNADTLERRGESAKCQDGRHDELGKQLGRREKAQTDETTASLCSPEDDGCLTAATYTLSSLGTRKIILERMEVEAVIEGTVDQGFKCLAQSRLGSPRWRLKFSIPTIQYPGAEDVAFLL